MVEPGGVAVQCTVTRGALGELVEGYGETTQSGQIIVFEQWRAAIERVASERYDAEGIEYGIVVVGPWGYRAYQVSSALLVSLASAVEDLCCTLELDPLPSTQPALGRLRTR